MRGADIVLVALGVLAVVATFAAALRSDELTGERSISFSTDETALAKQGPTDAGGAGAKFAWEAPDNATAASFTVNVTMQGMAFQGGSATVTIRVTSPDGRVHPPVTKSLRVAQGGASAAGQFMLNATWLEVPEDRKDQPSAAPHRIWDLPLTLAVSVDAPSDLPVASYGFTADVVGVVASYRAVIE